MAKSDAAITPEQAVATLERILDFYEADARREGGTAGMLSLRQAQLGREALAVLAAGAKA